MPYKHIAAHLKKTELACRLHFHQLSHGSHRRKRNASMSSSSSSASSARLSPTQYHLNGEPNYAATNAIIASQDFYAESAGHLPPLQGSPTHGRGQHKMLLPKPRPLTPEESPNRMMQAQNLRIDTNSMSASQANQAMVDNMRLQQIYEAHRTNFWSNIAQEYGTDISPRSLEQTWKQGSTIGVKPPTPGGSPDNRVSTYMLKPSAFPAPIPFGNMTNTHHAQDFQTMNSAVAAPTYGQYPTPTSASTGPYHTPVLPSHFVRNQTWAQPTSNTLGFGTAQSFGNMGMAPSLSSLQGGAHTQGQAPATAITALLTENKCPRHGQYCSGAHCV